MASLPRGVNSSSEVLGLLGKGLTPLVIGSLNVILTTACSGKPRYALPEKLKPVCTGENYVGWTGRIYSPDWGSKITVQVSAEEAAVKEKPGEPPCRAGSSSITAVVIAVAAR